MARQRIIAIIVLFLSSGLLQANSSKQEGCTVIGVGMNATIDGSVITSHTDCCSECRIQVIPGRAYPKGSMAPVHWGMVYFGGDDERLAGGGEKLAGLLGQG